MSTEQSIRIRALGMLEEGINPEIVLIGYEQWIRDLIAKQISKKL